MLIFFAYRLLFPYIFFRSEVDKYFFFAEFFENNRILDVYPMQKIDVFWF